MIRSAFGPGGEFMARFCFFLKSHYIRIHKNDMSVHELFSKVIRNIYIYIYIYIHIYIYISSVCNMLYNLNMTS